MNAAQLQVMGMKPKLETLLLRRMHDRGLVYETLGKKIGLSKSTVDERLGKGKLTTIADFEEIMDALGLVVVPAELSERLAGPDETIIPTEDLESLVTQAARGVFAMKEKYCKKP